MLFDAVCGIVARCGPRGRLWNSVNESATVHNVHAPPENSDVRRVYGTLMCETGFEDEQTRNQSRRPRDWRAVAQKEGLLRLRTEEPTVNGLIWPRGVVS